MDGFYKITKDVIHHNLINLRQFYQLYLAFNFVRRVFPS